MRNLFLLATWCVILIACTAQKSYNGYIFTSPRSLKIGSLNELQFLRFGNIDAEVVLKVRLYYSESYNSNETLALEKEYVIGKGEREFRFYLQVGPFPSDYVYNGRLEINGTIGDEEFGGSDKVYFSTPKSKIVIIQTDKPLYQPGQEVKFRVLKLDKTLKPSGDENDVAEVYVEDPKGTRLSQYNKVSLGQGMKQMEFQLSDEPVFGSWKITVNSENNTDSTNFDVKEYRLPKFGVKIKFPSYVLADSEVIPVEICAKYTYGKNVKGELKLNSSLESYSWSRDKYPVLQETIQLDGCYNYTLNVSWIETGSAYRYRRIMVVANVIEAETGVQMNATEYLQRQYNPLNLNFNSEASQRQYYKPGLPYNGKLKVTYPDDTPAGCEPIEICATISRERVISNWFGTKKVKFCSNYTSDDNGIVKYAIPPQNTDSTSIILEARSLKYAKSGKNSGTKENILTQPETSMSLSPFYSPSGSFIQMETIGDPLPCEGQKSIRLLFTSKEDADFEFYYQVIRQGEVVQTGTSKVSFTRKDDVSSKFENDGELIDESETQIIPAPKSSSSVSSSSGENDECPEAKEALYVPPIGEAMINVDIDASLTPSFSLLVFYIRDDRETVADSQKFQVEKCFKNKVGFEFGDEVKQPATRTSVKITASPNSLCGIKVVDKSISLLDSSDQLTASRVFQLMESMDGNIYYGSNPCNEAVPQPGLYATGKSTIFPPPGPYSSSSYEDSLSSFQDSGYLVISNLTLFTRPCSSSGGYGGPVYQTQSFADNAGGAGAPAIALASVARRPMVKPAAGASANAKIGVISTKSAVEVRDYFPETWLFKMETIGPDGVFDSKESLPHTITEWIGNAACISATDGLGISNVTSIQGFQAFFISYTLPVSVIRGEEFWIVVSIFNYADGSLPIVVSWDKPEGFEVTSDSIVGEICIQPGSSVNRRIKLKATAVGKVNITVRAETAQSSAECGSSVVSDSIAKDAITQSLNVYPEGFPVESIRSILFCPTNNENQAFTESYKLELPADVVNDSYRAYVDVTGNVMGPAIQNLNDLVALPTGCGEQNMVKFTPNYLVLDYLEHIDATQKELTDIIKKKAIRNLEMGYQRELNYRREDGSFSAFGNVDKEGSMFLSAFVLKSFYEAKRYITIDDSILRQIQEWIVSKQEDDGHFPNTGVIIDHGIQGGIEKEKNSGAITAYVLAALLISKYENETVINNAKSYLRDDNSNLSPYETFIYAYAEALGGNEEAAKIRLEQIKPRSNITDGVEFYKNPNGTKALNLETAAYAILTNLKVGNSASAVQPLVRYMTENLNPRGGFFSTQDTCVGLDALSKFASLVYEDPVDIQVEIAGGLEKKFEITQGNKLVVQRQKVSEVPSELKMEATGSGCGLIQTSLRYNTRNPPEKTKFNLGITSECLNEDCKRRRINLAVSYAPEGKAAGMSVAEVKMISGTVPDKDSLTKLIEDKKYNIMRTDVENNIVFIYFDNVTNAGVQFSFEVENIIEVVNPEPATAKVYDYYAPENSATTSYTNAEQLANSSPEREE